MAFLAFTAIPVPVEMLVGGLAGGLGKPCRKMITGGPPGEDRDAILAELRALSREGRNDAPGE